MMPPARYAAARYAKLVGIVCPLSAQTQSWLPSSTISQDTPQLGAARHACQLDTPLCSRLADQMRSAMTIAFSPGDITVDHRLSLMHGRFGLCTEMQLDRLLIVNPHNRGPHTAPWVQIAAQFTSTACLAYCILDQGSRSARHCRGRISS